MVQPIDERLYQVKLRKACFGIVTMPSDGREKVVHAAPIMSWAIGKSLATVEGWVAAKGGTLTRANP